MNHASPLATLLPALLLAPWLDAQTAALTRAGGTVGAPLTITVTGPASKACVLVPSLNAGPLPLAVLDPTDSRSLEVGVDLLSLVVAASLASPVKVVLQIPSDVSLNGQILHLHAFTFPGVAHVADELTNPARQSFGLKDAWLGRGKTLSEARALAGVAALPGGSYLLAGGGSGNLLNATGLKSSEIYDPHRQRFEKGPDLGAARALHRAVALQDGRVLIAGGVDALGTPISSCELYDPTTRAFTPAASLGRARAGHSADLLPDGRVLVAGGTSTFADVLQAINATTDTTEIYNPVTNTWSAGPRMSAPRLMHASVVLGDGRVLVSGGASYTTIIIKIPNIQASAEAYDPRTNSWRSLAAMRHARAGHDLIALAGGDVLATGGAQLQSITSIVAIDRAEVYGVAPNTWTETANRMTIARAAHATLRLPGGQVLVIGGATGSLTTPGSTASCDLFDPAARTFAPAPSMTTGRAGVQALLLPEGQVFVAGGGGGPSNAALDTGEMLFR